MTLCRSVLKKKGIVQQVQLLRLHDYDEYNCCTVDSIVRTLLITFMKIGIGWRDLLLGTCLHRSV